LKKKKKKKTKKQGAARGRRASKGLLCSENKKNEKKKLRKTGVRRSKKKWGTIERGHRLGGMGDSHDDRRVGTEGKGPRRESGGRLPVQLVQAILKIIKRTYKSRERTWNLLKKGIPKETRPPAALVAGMT